MTHNFSSFKNSFEYKLDSTYHSFRTQHQLPWLERLGIVDPHEENGKMLFNLYISQMFLSLFCVYWEIVIV